MLKSIGLPELIVISLVFFGIVGPLLLGIVPLWKIYSKAGYPGILSLTVLVPGLNVIMFYYLGFSDWPVLKELKVARARPLTP
jgi:hypothetical protein